MLEKQPQYGREALPSSQRRWLLFYWTSEAALRTQTLFIRVRGPTIVDIIKVWRRKNLKNNNLWLYFNWNFSFSNYFYFLRIPVKNWLAEAAHSEEGLSAVFKCGLQFTSGTPQFSSCHENETSATKTKAVICDPTLSMAARSSRPWVRVE